MCEPYRYGAHRRKRWTAWRSRPVSRILCPPRGRAATISLGAHAPRRCSPAPCGPPGSSDGPPSNAPCLALLRVGLAEPARSPEPLVSSYLTVSPLPRAANRAPAVCFLLRLREVTPAWVSPAPCPAESGLSSNDRRPSAAARPAPPRRAYRSATPRLTPGAGRAPRRHLRSPGDPPRGSAPSGRARARRRRIPTWPRRSPGTAGADALP